LENLWTPVFGIHVPYDIICIDVVLEMYLPQLENFHYFFTSV